VPSFSERVNQFFADITTDAEQERVIEYVIREVHKGRRLMEVIDDPYVRNRMNDDRRAEVFESPEVIEALEAEIRQTMTPPELGFGG
jgi:xanthine/CO dehydrogenase XdhC/CoxF family maturation factor